MEIRTRHLAIFERVVPPVLQRFTLLLLHSHQTQPGATMERAGGNEAVVEQLVNAGFEASQA